jgi:hypothetical protein
MALPSGSVLLIDRGDLPALAAAVIQPDPSRLVLWHRQGSDAASAQRAAAVETHAEMLGVADLIVSEGWDRRGVAGGAVDRGLEQSLLLLQAALVARETGCGSIIWPVQVGPDAARVGAAVDRAATMVDLALIDAAGPAERPADLVIDLPLVDLDEVQVVDLVDDAGAPLVAFWPCEHGGAEPCGSGCGGCDRWRRAFADLGLPWPWIAVPQ